MNSINDNKNKDVSESIKSYLDDCCFDFQTNINNPLSVSEAYLIKILTKIIIGSATAWWSLIELKNFIENRKTS